MGTDKKDIQGDADLRRRSALGQAIMLGTSLAVGMALFTLLGYYLDYRRGSGHFWTILGVVFGFVYCGYELWSTIRALNQTDPADAKASRPSDKFDE